MKLEKPTAAKAPVKVAISFTFNATLCLAHPQGDLPRGIAMQLLSLLECVDMLQRDCHMNAHGHTGAQGHKELFKFDQPKHWCVSLRMCVDI